MVQIFKISKILKLDELQCALPAGEIPPEISTG
jgi:hypothetical protein